jgi:hypothetical protein
MVTLTAIYTSDFTKEMFQTDIGKLEESIWEGVMQIAVVVSP